MTTKEEDGGGARKTKGQRADLAKGVGRERKWGTLIIRRHHNGQQCHNDKPDLKRGED